jgi:cytidylate kinase
MIAYPGFEKCLTFINTQMGGEGRNLVHADDSRRCHIVTISRQAGCGARAVAQHLTKYLQERTPPEEPNWAVFDRNIVAEVLRHHHMPERMAQFMSEKSTSMVNDTLDELFGLHPPSLLLVRQTAETILHLAKRGNVILIGRGANVVTWKLPGTLHVRLVASVEKRAQRLQEADKMGRKEALAAIRHEDKGRGYYLKKYYNKEIDDPLLYHLIINTDLISYEEAARVIFDYAVLRERESRRSAA